MDDDYNEVGYAPRPRARPPIGPAGLSLLGGAILLAVCAAILGLAANNTVQINDIKNRQEPTCVNMDQLSFYTRVANSVDAGVSTNVPDTIVAVGNDVDGGRVIIMVNTIVKIFRKSTMELLWSGTQNAFFNTTSQGDAYVTYDPISDRFFATALYTDACSGGVVVNSPPGLGSPVCSGRSDFGPSNFSLSGTVVATLPYDACAPITNAGALVGKIALIKRGGCNFLFKAQAAQAAGAIGVIIYNNAGTTGAINMAPADPSITIPCTSVGLVAGSAWNASLVPVVVTMSVTPGSPVYYSSGMPISVSKTSAPSSAADFYHYGKTVTPIWNVTFGDFPKNAAGSDAFYITTQDYYWISVDGNTGDYAGAHIVAFNKANLINGVGATLRWEKILPAQIFLMPAEIRLPLTSPNQPTYFVGPAGYTQNITTITDYAVYWGNAAGIHSTSPALIPVRPMPFLNNTTPGPRSRQPEPAASTGVSAVRFTQTAVAYQGSVWTAISYPVSQSHVVVRWTEFDVSTVWANSQVTLAQDGDLNDGFELDFSFGHMDIDRDGNMMISVVVSGPNQYPSLAYTGRLASDPKGTLRYPFRIWAQGNSTYISPGSGKATRYADYIGGVFDPVDRKTFWMYGQIPDPTGSFDVNGTATNYITVLGTAHLEKNGECPPQVRTRPAQHKINPRAEERYGAENPTPFLAPWGSPALNPHTGPVETA